MAHSIREQILQTAVNRIAPVVAPFNANVYRSPTVALTREQAPAIVLFPESDEVTERANNRVEHQLIVRLVALARGLASTSAETEADALLVATHAALMRESTFGGLAIGAFEIDCEWDIEDADSTVAAIPARYAIRYRTLQHDLTQRG
ncbi:MAG: hypothetical protein KTR20_04385 [Cellvibrionaceae bacterium]|nr:hypothetical protein [Cellvibrionaceae bacterium]